jgi:hypothetical protein
MARRVWGLSKKKANYKPAPEPGVVRSMHVHVPTARTWRLQVGQGADPGVRHLRRVQAPAAILTSATSRPWPLSRDSILELPPTSQSSSTAPRIRRSAEPLQFLGPIKVLQLCAALGPFRDDTVVLWMS